MDISSLAAKRQKTGDSSATQVLDYKAWVAFLQTNFFLKAPRDLFTVFELASELLPEKPCGEASGSGGG